MTEFEEVLSPKHINRIQIEACTIADFGRSESPYMIIGFEQRNSNTLYIECHVSIHACCTANTPGLPIVKKCYFNPVKVIEFTEKEINRLKLLDNQPPVINKSSYSINPPISFILQKEEVIEEEKSIVRKIFDFLRGV